MDRKLKKTDIAWFAGLFDGEGTIGFYRTVAGKGWSYAKFIGLSMGDAAVVGRARDILLSITGRSEIPIQVDARNDKRHPHVYYKLYVRKSVDILKILETIRPYLVGKKAQADLVIQLIKQHKHNSPYNPKEIAVIEALKILKRKSLGNPVPRREDSHIFSDVRRDYTGGTLDV